MEVAVRSYLTAGVALVGASVIAVSPIAPPLPDIHLPALRAEAVQLAASPFDIYAQVFQDALDNAGLQIDDYLADPLPITSQILANQVATVNSLVAAGVTAAGDTLTTLTTTVPALLEAAFNDLTSGDIAGAVNNVLSASLATLQPLFALAEPIGDAIAQPLQNVVNVIKVLTDPAVFSALGIGLLGPVISGAGATGLAIQNVIDAVGVDPQALLGAVIAGPAVIADGVLNGGYGPVLKFIPASDPLNPFGKPILVKAGGLLNSAEYAPGPTTVAAVAPGTVASLITLDQTLGEAITPPTMFSSLSAREASTFSATDQTASLTEAPAVRSGPIKKVIESLKATPGTSDTAKLAQKRGPIRTAVAQVRATVKQIRQEVNKALGLPDKKKVTADAAPAAK